MIDFAEQDVGRAFQRLAKDGHITIIELTS
jgi:hypothetical protein